MYTSYGTFSNSFTGAGKLGDEAILDSTSSSQYGSDYVNWEITPQVSGTLYYNFTFTNHTLESNVNGTHVTSYGMPSSDNLTGSFAVTAGVPFYITIVRPADIDGNGNPTTNLHGWMYLAL